jgi:iron complex outermembrane receptor protein
LKASFGTSFRAPNLRENFLAGQSGFTTIFDPCAVPDDAFVDGAYDADLDQREQTTLDNCIREGRDPTSVGIDSEGLNTNQVSSVEVTSGGSLNLDEETSRSFTAGFAWEQPFTDAFDFNLNMNYYKIRIDGAVVEPGAGFIVSDCFTRQDGIRSQFCDLISTENTNRQLVSGVAAEFINFDTERVSGLDINGTLGKEINAFNKNIDLGLAVRANKLLRRNSVFIDADGVETFDEDAGEFGFPEWTGRATFTADVDDFRFTWQARYIGDVEQQADGIDEFDDAFGNEGTGFLGDTCLGRAAGDTLCRDVGFADEYFTHTASIRYSTDDWGIRFGVANVFDEAPPLVDSNEVFAISNTPIGNGYDLDGREFFMTFDKRF